MALYYQKHPKKHLESLSEHLPGCSRVSRWEYDGGDI